jgi:ABC-2 type transport system ATP-binding protein
MTLLHIDHLALAIDDKPILVDVSLTVCEGEIVGLLGPNGAGKSTTIAAVLGLLPRQGGALDVLGQDPASVPSTIYRDIGVLPEQNGFYDWMTGENYLAFFAELHGVAPKASMIADRLTAVGLSPRPHQRIGTFSRGMRQRLGLARALIGAPRLLILDEPTNGLDPRGRHEVHELLRGLAAQGTGILMCTHLLDDVERLCRRVVVIAEGRTRAEGTISDLVARSEHANSYRLRLSTPPTRPAAVPGIRRIEREGETWLVDLEPDAAAEAVWSELIDQGWKITEIRSEGRGLESLYLSLTDASERKAA